MLVAALVVQQQRHLELDLDDVVLVPQPVQLAGRQAHVGTDHDQAVPGGRPFVVGVLSLVGHQLAQSVRRDRRCGPLADAGPDERRTDPVDEVLPVRLGLEQGRHEHPEVGVGGRVDHRGTSVAQLAEQLAHPGDTAGADVGQRDPADVVACDPTLGLLRDPVAQIGADVAEAGVPGELAVRHGDHAVRGSRPVHGVDGEPARLDVGRDDQHTVDRLPAGGELGGDHIGLQREVAAQASSRCGWRRRRRRRLRWPPRAARPSPPGCGRPRRRRTGCGCW